LTISAEKLRPDVGEGEKFLRAERPFGKFQRALTLPDTADLSGVSTGCLDGVLRVRIPKVVRNTVTGDVGSERIHSVYLRDGVRMSDIRVINSHYM
jgi:HSP20 family molecular chaperone IbpA